MAQRNHLNLPHTAGSEALFAAKRGNACLQSRTEQIAPLSSPRCDAGPTSSRATKTDMPYTSRPSSTKVRCNRRARVASKASESGPPRSTTLAPFGRGSSLRTNARARAAAITCYLKIFQKIAPTLRCRPDFVHGTPVARDTLRFAAVMPSSRFHENPPRFVTIGNRCRCRHGPSRRYPDPSRRRGRPRTVGRCPNRPRSQHLGPAECMGCSRACSSAAQLRWAAARSAAARSAGALWEARLVAPSPWSLSAPVASLSVLVCWSW